MASAAAKIEEVEFNWPEPEPLLPTRADQAEFPTGFLSTVLREAVEAIGRTVKVPHSMAAQSVLSACSLAIQPHFNVVLPTGQERPISLYFATIADSGDRKSSSDDKALEAIRSFEMDLESEFGAQKAEAGLRQAAWDEAKKAATQRCKKDGMAALEQAYRDLGPRPEGPIEPTIAVRTGTMQGFLKRFVTCRPSLGLMSSEGGSWLGGYAMQDEQKLNTIATLSDFWDGTNVQTLTSGDGFTALRNRRLTFHMMLQPIIAEELLGDPIAMGQGFLARMLVSWPESLAGTRFVDPHAPADLAAKSAIATYTARLSEIVKAELPVDPTTMGLTFRALPLTVNATLIWWEFFNKLEARLKPDGDLRPVKGFVGKLPEMAARIAANLAVFENGHRVHEVDVDDLTRGIGLAEFYLAEALRLFGQQSLPKIYSDAEEVSNWLRVKWTENLVSASMIANRGPGSLRKKTDYIRDILAILERHNHVAQVENGGMVSGKKVRQAWRVLVRDA